MASPASPRCDEAAASGKAAPSGHPCRAAGPIRCPAHVAQSVEHFLGKEEVAGSIPVISTILPRRLASSVVQASITPVAALYHGQSASHAVLGRSSNGRTADSDSAYLGSNPSLPASMERPLIVQGPFFVPYSRMGAVAGSNYAPRASSRPPFKRHLCFSPRRSGGPAPSLRSWRHQAPAWHARPRAGETLRLCAQLPVCLGFRGAQGASRVYVTQH